jgi:hypothetical protein
MGIVLSSDPERTSVDFDDHGSKLFVTSLLSAEIIGEAPARRRSDAPCETESPS